MERLFDFLFGNLIYVIIIIGVITSFLGKLRGGGQQPPGGMPTFGGGGGQNGQRMPSGRSTTAEQRTPEPLPQRHEPAVLRQQSKPARQLKVDPAFADSSSRSMAAPSLATLDIGKPMEVESIDDDTSPVYRPDLRTDLKRRAVDGMVWAEIFNRPRALRSHGDDRIKPR